MAAGVKPGITEEYWGIMSEDRKLCWELFTRALAIAAAWFVAKTGVMVVDCIIGVLTAYTPLLVIRSQRSFRKYSKAGRKRLAGAVVFLGSTGAAVLGLLYFGIAFLSAVFQTYATEIAPLKHHPDSFGGIFMLGAFLIAGPIAGVKVWRDLKLSEIIFALPKLLLKRLLLQRKYVADAFLAFAHFELTVQGLAFVYASVCAQIVKVYLNLF